MFGVSPLSAGPLSALPVSGDASVAGAVVAATTSIPTPSVSVGGSVTINAAVVTATTSIPSPTVTAGASVSPAVVAAVAAVASPTPSAGVTITATVVTATTSIPAPTVDTPTLITATVVTATSYVYGAVIDPAVMTGLILWLRATDMSLSDGDPADSTWNDQSSVATNDGTKNGTNNTYETVETNAGGPIVRGSGSAAAAGGYSLPSGMWTGKTAGEVILYVKALANNSDNPNFVNLAGSDRTYYPFTDSKVYDGAFTATRESWTPSVSLNTFRVVSISKEAGTGPQKFRIDNTVEHTITGQSFVAPSTPGVLGNGSFHWRGDCAEILAFDRVLTDAERLAVYEYLRYRHALLAPSSSTAQVSAAASVSPAVVAAVATVPSPTPGAGATVTATVVTASTTIPTPTVIAGSGGSETVLAGSFTVSTTIGTPVVTGVDVGPGPPPPPPSGAVNDGSGDTFTVLTPRASFELTYVPAPYSEHITVTAETATGLPFRKLRRGAEWRLNNKTLILTDDPEMIFTGTGPWRLEAQYAYGGVGGSDPVGGGSGGGSGNPPEPDPPPDPDTPPPPTVPPPPGSTYYGSSPNGASGGSKSSIVAYVNSIFGGIRVLRAFDDFPTSWSDTRTARYAPAGIPVIISIKPGMANLVGQASAQNQVKAFLRTIPSDRIVVVVPHHEPENDTSAIPAGDTNTGTLFKQMMVVFLRLVDEVRSEGVIPNVLTGSILMSFSVLHRNPEDWYTPGVDILGWDTYNRANLTALRNYSIGKGKPWMVCEIGAKPVADYSDAQYADELEAFYNIWTTGATQPFAVCYFQSTVGDNYVITPETRPISVAWWRHLCETGSPP